MKKKKSSFAAYRNIELSTYIFSALFFRHCESRFLLEFQVYDLFFFCHFLFESEIMPPKKKKIKKKKTSDEDGGAPVNDGSVEGVPNAGTPTQGEAEENDNADTAELPDGDPATAVNAADGTQQDRPNGDADDATAEAVSPEQQQLAFNDEDYAEKKTVGGESVMLLLSEKNHQQWAASIFYRWKEYVLYRKARLEEEKERFLIFCSEHASLKHKSDEEIAMVLGKYAGKPSEMWMDIYRLYGATGKGADGVAEEGGLKVADASASVSLQDKQMERQKEETSRKILQHIDSLKEHKQELERAQHKFIAEQQGRSQEPTAEEAFAAEKKFQEFSDTEKKLQRTEERILQEIFRDLNVPMNLPNRRMLQRQLEQLKAQIREKDAQGAVAQNEDTAHDARYSELAQSTSAAVSQIEILTQTCQAQRERIQQLEAKLMAVDRRHHDTMMVVDRQHTDALKAATLSQVDLKEENASLRSQLAQMQQQQENAAGADDHSNNNNALAIQQHIALERDRELNVYRRANDELKQKLDEALLKLADFEEEQQKQQQQQQNRATEPELYAPRSNFTFSPRGERGGEREQQKPQLSGYNPSAQHMDDQKRQRNAAREPPGWNPWGDHDPHHQQSIHDTRQMRFQQQQQQQAASAMQPPAQRNLPNVDDSYFNSSNATKLEQISHNPPGKKYSLADRSTAHFKANDPTLLTRTGMFLSEIDGAENVERRYFDHLNKQRAVPQQEATARTSQQPRSQSRLSSSLSSFLRRRGDDVVPLNSSSAIADPNESSRNAFALNTSSQFYNSTQVLRNNRPPRPEEPRYDTSTKYFPLHLHQMKI